MPTNSAEVTQLKQEWDALQPLSPDRHARFWQKLRLEWNYHSNRIEGNTLTYGETANLILHNITSGIHDLRDFEEMKAHNVGIEHLRHLAQDQSRDLQESDIRDLNQIILKEPFEKEAVTPDGQRTRKTIFPGKYKELPNNVRTTTGEIFHFADPLDVEDRMHELVNAIRQIVAEPVADLSPLLAKIHHEFVLIHPFDDGNGRVARMLVNYLLLRCDYPPLVIRSDDKDAYLSVLRAADGGNLIPLEDFLRDQLKTALELGIRAARGENLEEPGDLEKEIAIFIRNQPQRGPDPISKSPEALENLYHRGISELFAKCEECARKFTLLFERILVLYSPDGTGYLTSKQGSIKNLLNQKNPDSFTVLFEFNQYKKEANFSFSLSQKIRWTFEEHQYVLHLKAKPEPCAAIIRHPYDTPPTPEEIQTFTQSFLRSIFDEIKTKTGQA